MMRHEFSRLRTLLRIQAMGHLPEPFQRVEQVQNPYGLGKPFCRQLPQLAFPIHDTDARLLVCRVPPTTLHKNLEEQHRCGGQHLPFLKPGHLCPHMLVLRFGPLPGTLSPTHLVDHVFGSTREAGLGVNRSHIRHLFFPGRSPAAFLLPRQTLDRRRRRRLFLDSRDSCRFRACGISSLFSHPSFRLCSQPRRQRPPHGHTLAIGRYHQQFLLFFGRRNRFAAKVVHVLRHLATHVLRRANTHRGPQPGTERLHRSPKGVLDAQPLQPVLQNIGILPAGNPKVASRGDHPIAWPSRVP